MSKAFNFEQFQKNIENIINIKIQEIIANEIERITEGINERVSKEVRTS